MELRKSSVVVGVLALALVSGGCSSYVGSETPAAETTVPTRVQPPPWQLQGTLEVFSDPAAPREERWDSVVNGAQIAPALQAVESALSGHGEITYQVTNVRVNGDTATATVVVDTPEGIKPLKNPQWNYVDGRWRISQPTACALSEEYAHHPCGQS